MALKDLVADHNKLNEEVIEKIVSPYVRYDPRAYKIVLSPEGGALGNDAKVLVYLVAVLGWQYVVDEPQPVGTKPADLEDALGIHGGTLRPILKRLKDSHLLEANGGNYAVQIANLGAVGAMIGNSKAKPATKRQQRRKSKQRASSRAATKAASEGGAEKRSASDQLKPTLAKWVEDGILDEPKTLAALLERYHEHGVITKRTSLSGLLLRAVRQGLLCRTKVEEDGKWVWAYRAKDS